MRGRTHAHTHTHVDRESLSRLRETDPRNVHPHVERRNASHRVPCVHRGGFFPPRRGDAKCTRAATRAATHAGLPRDNKLSGLCIGRKQRRPFICKILARRESRGLVSSSSSRARKPAPSFLVKNDLTDNRRSGSAEAAGSAALLPFAPFLDRSLCLDRSIALSGESV